MSRTPGAPRSLVLPRPSEKYDAADQIETRRLIEQNARLLNDYSTLISIPKPVSALGSLTGAADMVPYFTSASVMALASLTPYARTIIACANAAAMRTLLGLGPLAILIPPNDATKFLNGAASPAWAAVKGSDLDMSDVTTNNVTSALHGFAPKSPNDATKFLSGAATPGYAQVKDSDLALTNVTTNDVSIVRHGFTPILPNDATKFLNGVGGYTVPAGSGSGFPGSLPSFPAIAGTIQLRLSAEPSISTLTKNTDGLLAQWNDASGNWGSNFTATTTARPRWIKRALLAGRPGVVFDGITCKMVAGAAKTLAQPFTAIVVLQDWGTGAVNSNIYRDSNNGPVFFLSGSSWALFAGTGLTSTAMFTQNRQAVPRGHIGAAAVSIQVYNGNSSILSNNGVETTGPGGATGITGTMRIGGDVSTSFADAIIYEILFVSGAMSPADRAAINTYYATALEIDL